MTYSLVISSPDFSSLCLDYLQVDRIVPVATREAMTDFGHLFAERSRKNLADGHLWFSVVARPPQSRFTCVQRVSCCLSLLCASMLANAMFYRTEKDTSGTSNGITIGPFSVSPEQVELCVASCCVYHPSQRVYRTGTIPLTRCVASC